MTIEAWAEAYIRTEDLAIKLRPPPLPTEWEPCPIARRLSSPGRPHALRVEPRAKKTRGLGSASGRARALHTFFHHELQAAELMAWAILAFADAPRDFREGLARIAIDEARHMRMYARQIDRLGHAIGDFPVRDWFWERIPTCADPASFVAVMGLGLESANLEHTKTFAERFRAVGDDEGARIQEIVGREEIAHARFAAEWFVRFRSELAFDTWRTALPAPLTPLLMRGRPIHRDARLRAGQPPAFIEALDSWSD
jgi:uncharacterized ferritin-like protein (DUF455 family)